MSFTSKCGALFLGLILLATVTTWAQQPITSPDGGLASVGAKSDAAETNVNASNSLISFTKGVAKILADMWDSVNHRMRVDGSGVTQPVSAVSLPLPAGASSEGTLNTRLGEGTFTGRFPAAFASADSISAQTATFVHGGMMGWNSAATKWDRIQLDASNNLKVVIATGSMPVTGTFWQATQPVSGTFWQATQPVSIATMPTTPVTGTFWQATQPISAVALPLPSGAATSAKQPALGTAGTPSADVLSVQGAASMTPIKTDGSAITQPVSGAVTANAGTNLNTSSLALESGGNLAAINTATGATTDTAVTGDTSGTLSGKLRGLVKIFTDVWDGSNHWLKVSIQNSILSVSNVPATSGGLSTCAVQSGTGTTASTNATNCKGSAGQIYTIRAINTTSTMPYLRMYNTSGTPDCSSATGFIESIPIPATTGSTGAGVAISQDPGQAFSAGIGFCVTGGGANNDNTNAPAGVFITVLYK